MQINFFPSLSLIQFNSDPGVAYAIKEESQRHGTRYGKIQSNESHTFETNSCVTC